MKSSRHSFAHQWQIQIMALAGILFLLVFAYIPMFGVVIAFKNLDYRADA